MAIGSGGRNKKKLAMDKAAFLPCFALFSFILHSEGKIVDLTHFVNDNDTMIWPDYNEFYLEIQQRGWIDLENGGRAW